MPDAAAQAEAPIVPPKKKKRFLLYVAIAFVLIVVAAGAGFKFARHGNSANAAPKVKLTQAAGYYNLKPPLVVNFTNDRAIHFLQVGISLESHDPAALDAARAAGPKIRNALLLLLGGQNYKTLSTTQGKLALQNKALAKVQAIVRKSIGRPGIQALYFTSYVMQ
jgi:flagellar FliL protein